MQIKTGEQLSQDDRKFSRRKARVIFVLLLGEPLIGLTHGRQRLLRTEAAVDDARQQADAVWKHQK